MRYGDNSETDAQTADFVPRERSRDIWRVIFGFALALLLMLFLNFMPNTVGGATEASLISLIGISALCFYIVYQKQQNLDLVMATEFQNLLFAQAAAQGSDFCLFVKRDGVIVYANDGLRRLFPNIAYGDANALSALFDSSEMNIVDRDRVMSAIYANERERLIFPMRDASGSHKEYILIIDPLSRPPGYIVIRGREYFNKRVGSESFPEVLRTTSPESLEHLLSYTPAPLFVTDEYGNIAYSTPALESLLGYGAGEIAASKMRIHHLVSKIGNEMITEEYRLHDAQTNADAMHKTGKPVHVMLSLFAMRDRGGKVVGASGTLIPVSR
jgi:PAS domain S-box-containing protein